ncbi:hypothetical protein [Catellatospora sp. NPDC049133]|uniref:hypothetical protein n=1 Tax=Catellatospora sp. NPDC049133 TaxID=3155499 RepID=UPI0033FC6097
MWSVSPSIGDQYCTGGSFSGELCGWSVNGVGVNFWVGDKYKRNMTRGAKSGLCTTGGDSGGPIYTVLGNGNVVAKGIHSTGGSSGGCTETFTDIRLAYFGFPGQIREI